MLSDDVVDGSNLSLYDKFPALQIPEIQRKIVTILTDAYKLLQTRAANISDEHLRGCFLNNVPVNREIVEEYEKNRLSALKN